ncbi:hypothetical protein CAP35_05230 [Chitinophagaceae bacterium IBVUCB1]|nr:hypothetical protein CAP35_05230 [Chitinophagaceae bacterium IBVUCB1]
MENNAENIVLINGEFDAVEAKDIILSLLNDKIGFQALKNLRHEEKKGKPDAHALQRIAELKQTIDKLTVFFNHCNDQGHRLNMHSEIKIEITQ